MCSNILNNALLSSSSCVFTGAVLDQRLIAFLPFPELVFCDLPINHLNHRGIAELRAPAMYKAMVRAPTYASLLPLCIAVIV